MGWIIAGAVVAVILILLMTSVKVRFEFSDPGELRLKISWLFVTLVRIPAKTKKQKRRDKKAEKDVKSAAKAAAELEKSEDTGGGRTADPQTLNESKSAEQNKPQESQKSQKSQKTERGKSGKPPKSDKPKSQKLTLSDIFALVKLVWDSLGKPLKRLLKATRVTSFRLDISVGGDDAADAAIKFGKTNMAAGAALAFLDCCFTLKDPKFNVTCNFQSEETRTECGFTARLTVIAALAFLFWVAGRLIRNYTSRKDAAAAVDKLRK